MAAGGGTTTFTVRLDTATSGTKTGDVTFSTNDSNENPFNFRITGTVSVIPEIVVLGNGVNITDGDTTPTTADHTDFGVTAQGGLAMTRTFTIRNDGNATLTLGTVTVPTGFTVTAQPASSVAAGGGTTTFTVNLNTATEGTKSGDVSFSTNDGDENPFNFRITGIVGMVSEITVLGNAVSIPDGDTTPTTADHSDFGSVTQGGTPVSWTFTVRNDGNATLTLGTVTAPTGFTVTTQPSTSVAAGGGTTTFTVRLDTATSGTKSGDVSFSTNDCG